MTGFAFGVRARDIRLLWMKFKYYESIKMAGMNENSIIIKIAANSVCVWFDGMIGDTNKIWIIQEFFNMNQYGS